MALPLPFVDGTGSGATDTCGIEDTDANITRYGPPYGNQLTVPPQPQG